MLQALFSCTSITEYLLNNEKKFAENNIPGMSLIKDPANKRAPILAINKKIFASKIEVKGWSEFDKQYKWIELFTKLVMENPEVAIIE